ncbi:MAG: hypothetical protein F9K42_11995 [Ignavibacterium sp.]|nr:MAG: hypothetical protein F9K42_11995 [Ignavibacterium sp.]
MSNECNDPYTNEIQAIISSKSDYLKILESFKEVLHQLYNEEKERPIFYKGVSPGWKVTEILAQWNPYTQAVIDAYQKNLIEYRDKNLTKNCNYEVDTFFEEEIYNFIISNK